MSHPDVSALKICISSSRLRSEVRKKVLLEIQRQNKVRGDKVRGKQTGTQRLKLLFPGTALSFDFLKKSSEFPGNLPPSNLLILRTRAAGTTAVESAGSSCL